MFLSAIFLADPAYTDEWEISDEEIARIQSQAIPMPFPEATAKGYSDQPVRMVYKYDPSERPLLDIEPRVDQITALPLANGEKADDGPLRITETEEFPYSSVVHIYMEYDGSYYSCSGAFVRNTQLILTAAHCVYHHADKLFECCSRLPAKLLFSLCCIP